MRTVRIGVLGLGNIGAYHAACLAQGQIAGATLAAVADVRPGHARSWCSEHAFAACVFEDAGALVDSGACDAVIVATPPPLHPPLAIQAFSRGLHVLIEKPAGICARDVRAMNAAAKSSGRVFGIQFPHRLYPVYRKARELIRSGELGALRRTQWTSTRWYRTQDYYDSGGWRGTWRGEGGGVLVNQCPHDLDIWTWLCGVPARLRAFCRFGQWHDIEVEDEVSAYLEYPGGASGVFICSTGEHPGTNRLEIVGDHGTLTIQNDRQLEFRRLSESLQTHGRTGRGFSVPEAETVDIPLPDALAENSGNVREFVSAIREGTPLTSPGEEGLNSLELANAMQLSSWLDATVDVPVDADRYAAELETRMRASTIRKPATTRSLDITASWR